MGQALSLSCTASVGAKRDDVGAAKLYAHRGPGIAAWYCRRLDGLSNTLFNESAAHLMRRASTEYSF